MSQVQQHLEIPQSDEAERSVLGAILVDGQYLDQIGDMLKPEDFYRPAHQRLYRSMLEMNAESQPIDPLTLAERHIGDGVIDAIGGASYISRLLDGIPRIVNARHYAEIVRTASIRRQLVRTANDLVLEASLGEQDVDAMLGQAQRRLSDLGLRRQQRGPLPMKAILEASLDDIERRQGMDTSITGVPSGFTRLDDLTSGWQRGELIILAARPSMGKCVAWDTPIVEATSGEVLTAQELYERGTRGERVSVFTLNDDGKLIPTTPSAYIDDGVKPVFRVRTRLGREVTTTASHPFLTGSGWKPLFDLKPGVRIALPRAMGVFGRNDMPEHEVALVALLIGDGCISQTSPRITTTSEVLRAEIEKQATSMGLQLSPELRSDRAPTYRLVTPRGRENPLLTLLERHGLRGCTASTKHVPAPFFRLPRHSMALFLNRLFATDGTAWTARSYARIAYATVSKRLARDVQHLLLRFGIVSKLRERSIAYRDQRRQAFEVEIMGAADILRFAEEIGILGKEAALARVVALMSSKRPGWTKDTLPGEAWEAIDAARGDLSWAEVSRRAGRPSSHNWHAHRRQPRRETVALLAAVLDAPALATMSNSDLLWDEIVAIESVGDQQVYDLTIPETHNFVASDVLVHNTALALSMAQNAAVRHGKRIAVFSLEMAATQLAMRMLCSEARVDAQKVRRGQLGDLHWSKIMRAFTQLAEAPIYIDETPAITLTEMRAKCRRLAADPGLDMIVVDYLQLMGSSERTENRQQEISTISRGLKGLALDLQVPVMALSQLSRAPDQRQGDHRPMLSDLRESGSLEQDADVVMFIYREEVYRRREGKDPGDKRGIAEIIIGKQRNGPIDTVKLAFINQWTRFENYAPESGEAPMESQGGGDDDDVSDDATPF